MTTGPGKIQSAISWIFVALLWMTSIRLLKAQDANPSPVSPAAAGPQAGTASVVPRLINFNGTIKNADGKPQSGEVTVTFSLYELQEGGDQLWSETQTVTADEQGRYTVVLGSAQDAGLPVGLFSIGQP